MGLFRTKNTSEKLKQVLTILTVFCYWFMISGVVRACELIYNIVQGGDYSLSVITYTVAPSIVLVCVSVFIVKLVRNVRRGEVFVMKNAQYLKIIGVIVALGSMVQHYTSATNGCFGSYTTLYLLGLFIMMLGVVFHIGIRMKEEQDLTI
ncbi:DUF2975 domain-containing protein [Bacteroides sp.]|uniref:DUF2975 domain-containing protein n=1 Tax=Bacteroides sp. TaxID=29523 RepID=UPI0026245E82|nr:DUF2975 domain-containing protein [Bacteroides sp.]